MHLRQVCPQCNTILHARLSICGCGHAFPLKRKGQCIADKSKSQVMKRKRKLETELERRQKDKVRKVSMRAYETAEETLHRKESNKKTMVNKRKRNVSIEHAISAFNCEIRNGPDFVCTCCHRMMYKKTVVPCNKDKYTKASNAIYTSKGI